MWMAGAQSLESSLQKQEAGARSLSNMSSPHRMCVSYRMCVLTVGPSSNSLYLFIYLLKKLCVDVPVKKSENYTDVCHVELTAPSASHTECESLCCYHPLTL